MNKPRALIRSRKLERKVAGCGFNFDELKSMYGSRMVIVDRSWCYVGREDQPDYVRYNDMIQELFSKHPKVFYGYCGVEAVHPYYRITPPSAHQYFVGGGYNLSLNLPSNPPSNPPAQPYLYGQAGPIYIGGKSEKDILSVIDRAQRHQAMW